MSSIAVGPLPLPAICCAGRGVGKLWTCALIDKPGRRKVEVKVDFVGFPVGNVFIAGYGTDYAEKYRHLPYIGIVE